MKFEDVPEEIKMDLFEGYKAHLEFYGVDVTDYNEAELKIMFLKHQDNIEAQEQEITYREVELI